MTGRIVAFWGERNENGEFSNFYRSRFKYKGLIFDYSEIAFMWEKAMLFKDREVADKIMLAKYPKDAKYLGRQVRNYDDKIWSEKRYEIMVSVLKEKFNQNLYLKNKLRKTGNSTLVEASPYDKIWGVGVDYKYALNPNNWIGQNLLGKALMEVRDSF